MHEMMKTSSASSFTPITAGKIQLKRRGLNVLDEDCPRCHKGLLNLQRSSTKMADASSVPPVIHEVLNSPGEPLDDGTRAFMEPRFGHDFSKVRVHTDEKAAMSARAINALAYTVGSDIGFESGQYMPGTVTGKALIAHELAHVVQQKGTMPSFNLGINQSNDQMEKEAQKVAMQVIMEPSRVKPVNIITSSRPTIARGEKWDAIWGVGPWDAYKAKKLADKALSAAQKTGLPGLHNGPADAWRHCYWNCTMTAEIGADQAKVIADNHEKHGSGPENENKMDYHNNDIGRSCGGKDCDKCCQDKLDNGSLMVIDTSGKVVPSTSTSRSTVPASGSGDYKY